MLNVLKSCFFVSLQPAMVHGLSAYVQPCSALNNHAPIAPPDL